MLFTSSTSSTFPKIHKCPSAFSRKLGLEWPLFGMSRPPLNPCYNLHEVPRCYVQDTLYHTSGEYLAAEAIFHYVLLDSTYQYLLCLSVLRPPLQSSSYRPAGPPCTDLWQFTCDDIRESDAPDHPSYCKRLVVLSHGLLSMLIPSECRKWVSVLSIYHKLAFCLSSP